LEKIMNIRKPIVAGQFYPSSKSATVAGADECLLANISIKELPEKILGGVVPHAGWVCSGHVAGKVFRAVQMRQEVETFVLFGAVHRYGGVKAAVFSAGGWETPLGQIEIDDRLAAKILVDSNLCRGEPGAHDYEHSIEVQVPFIQRLFPKARILPIMVPPSICATEVGMAVARAIREAGTKVVCLGSSDLTHYGPSYQFSPHGSGQEGICWAKDVNDRGLLDLVEKMDAEGVLEYARDHQAACGAGAIAACIGCAKQLGANMAKTLEHTNSYEVLSKRFGERGDDAVGYAGIIFGMRETG
jgi:AmmeMemoRadiSam system protein B